MNNLKLKLSFFFVFCIFASGCGYELPEKPIVDENAATTNQTANKQNAPANGQNGETPAGNSQVAANANAKNNGPGGGTLVLSATAENATYPCNQGSVEIDESATANDYKFTGECKKITVKGVSNKIFVEKVGEIEVSGISNKISYGEGIDGKKPKIKTSGKSTVVETKKEQDERKAAEANKAN